MSRAHIAATEGTQACKALTGILAANLGVATGFDQGSTALASAPVITSVPLVAGTAARAYRYAASVTDPQNLAISWSLPESPGAMHIGADGVLGWIRRCPAATRSRCADNGRAYAEQRNLLTVGNEAIPQFPS